MKQIIKIILVSVGLFLVISSKDKILPQILGRHIQAVGDLVIDWGVPGGQPIFVITNFQPGQREIREIKVINNAMVSRPVGIKGRKTVETGNLASVLEFIIFQNGTNIYGGTAGRKTLAQFFQESEGIEAIHLGGLNPGQEVKYTFEVFFAPESGNEFQGKNIVFDLEIGIAVSIPQECRGIKFSGPPIFGTAGADNLKGTNGNDLIFGFEGNDKISGGNGDDCLIGSLGNDELDGGNGKDIVLGEEGNDRIDGDNAEDRLLGGAGDDKIEGGNGEDVIYGGLGNDEIDGGNGDDFVDGGSGNDELTGKNGNDTLIGGEDKDRADGGLGVDVCQVEIKRNCER